MWDGVDEIRDVAVARGVLVNERTPREAVISTIRDSRSSAGKTRSTPLTGSRRVNMITRSTLAGGRGETAIVLTLTGLGR